MKCIVHVGYMKTGSTSIQEFFHVNRDDFLRLGINYMDMDSSNHSWGIWSAYSQALRPEEKDGGGTERTPECGEGNATRQRILKAFATNESPFFIISGETICHLSEAGLDRLFKDISEYFSEITVIIYLREIVSYAQSAVNEAVKTMKTPLRPMLKSLQSAPARRIPYRSHLEKLLGVVDKSSIICREFDREKMTGEDVVPDFIGAAGIPKEVLGHYTRQEFNKSPSYMTMLTYSSLSELLRTTRITSYPSLEIENEIRTLLNMFRSSKFRLSNRLSSHIYESMGEDITWIHRNFGILFQRNEDRTGIDKDDLLKINVYASLCANALTGYVFTGKISFTEFSDMMKSLYVRAEMAEPPAEFHISLLRLSAHSPDTAPISAHVRTS